MKRGGGGERGGGGGVQVDPGGHRGLDGFSDAAGGTVKFEASYHDGGDSSILVGWFGQG